VQGTYVANAQSARLDQGAHSLDLNGDVHLADGQSTMAAEYFHYDTLTKDVHTEGHPVEMTQPANLTAPPSSPPAAPPVKKP
jgi:hypothetical protein